MRKKNTEKDSILYIRIGFVVVSDIRSFSPLLTIACSSRGPIKSNERICDIATAMMIAFHSAGYLVAVDISGAGQFHG